MFCKMMQVDLCSHNGLYIMPAALLVVYSLHLSVEL